MALLVFAGLQPLYADEKVYSIEWEDLMPAHILQMLDDIPMVEHDYSEDATDPFTDDWEDPYADAWNEILTSTEVVDAYENNIIRLPGFVVPLDVDDDQRVLSFFIVPYFGACIHVPPPPPNQLIYVADVDNAPPLRVESMYTAFWFTGRLKISEKQHDMGHAAYSMELLEMEKYQF
ncbi:DUF3299 domain-containing protein [Aliidiomarina minuta]|uniref:DUF3299 domain-containing protein n=1 Tax=Aliidiomarina minuta TaxID=880057 RepID=UPI001F5439B9|nr:DUF3299 domain-containing protein [Aliidiomarina minuta]